ncbi:MAG: AbrB/MazE/SpoVT family DNA-binding domain-containing protein [Ruminococcus sp.]|nr:AbrB/MazE/SpoVT family DNA-binding domain-containing protein [Ruminococcus sp.]
MKATGIVRRIDDLGRVVIPKEIRRTMRIREGDPLEIYTDTNGEVIFKKYSPIGELGPYTKQYVEVLNRSTGLPAIICDRDPSIAAAGIPKKDVMDKRISPMAESYMEKRANYVYETDKDEFTVCDTVDRKVSVLSPIIGAGDVMGAVMVLTNGNDAAPTQTEIKLVQVAAGFLGKQMEE